jgi:glycine dehydrogenase subunit 1
VANASMYDGSTAMTEAVLMAERLTSRRRVLVARSVHPEYREVLATYARNLGLQIDEIGYLPSGEIDDAAISSTIDAQTAAVVVQSPNFFGVLEPLAKLAAIAHGAQALLITTIAEGVSLGLVKPPAEADIVAMEAQSFGLPPSYGGPYAGVIATREKHVRQMPGRLAGQTTDAQGRRGFCLTLATREQHIRRERATSNICTNQALCALAATIHLCLLGKEGLREMAVQNVSKTQFALSELEKIPGVRRVFTGNVFNEFVLRFPRAVKLLNAALLKEKIIGPLALGRSYPELTKCGLICVTETMSRSEIERFVAAVRTVLEQPV